MGFLSRNFNTKEEMAEWLVLNVEDTFDQQELMFEGLTHFQEKGSFSIRPRRINIKLKDKVTDENGDVLYLEDCILDEQFPNYPEKIIRYKENPLEDYTSSMSIWKWIKLQTPRYPELDGDAGDMLI